MNKQIILSGIEKLQDTLSQLKMRVFVIDNVLRQWNDNMELTRDVETVNVAVFAKEIHTDLFKVLDKANITVRDTFGTTECGLMMSLEVDPDIMSIDSTDATCKINLYFVYESPINNFYHVDWIGPVADTKNLYQMHVNTYERFRLKKVHLHSLTILVPKHVPEFLEARYGKDFDLDTKLQKPEPSTIVFAKS